jgi:hypothetical protein
MTSPAFTVTERTLGLEPVSRDPFADGLDDSSSGEAPRDPPRPRPSGVSHRSIALDCLELASDARD